MSARGGESLEDLTAVLQDLIGALHSPERARQQIVVPAAEMGETGGHAQARYRALVEQIPAITFTVNLEEGTPELYVGPQIEEILGFSQTEWLEDPILWFEQCHPEDRDIWHQEFARGIATGGPFHAECRVFAKDGHEVWLRGEARLVRDDAGQPLFLQGIAFDITESKRAEQKMREANEIRVFNERLSAVGQMAASIGHDLRNPLGAIRNAWASIEKRIEGSTLPRDDAQIAALSRVINRELGRCTSIISELLEFARDRPPHRVAVPLAEMIDEVFSVVSRPAPTMRLVNEVPPDLAPPYLDADQFRQVLVNLVQNGLEAITKTGLVRVLAYDDPDRPDAIVIEIIDDGRGIAADVLELIWKPLFTTKARGTGLGLPIVANIVQRHDGQVALDTSPGKGARFRLLMPRSQPSEGPGPQR